MGIITLANYYSFIHLELKCYRNMRISLVLRIARIKVFVGYCNYALWIIGVELVILNGILIDILFILFYFENELIARLF